MHNHEFLYPCLGCWTFFALHLLSNWSRTFPQYKVHDPHATTLTRHVLSISWFAAGGLLYYFWISNANYGVLMFQFKCWSLHCILGNIWPLKNNLISRLHFYWYFAFICFISVFIIIHLPEDTIITRVYYLRWFQYYLMTTQLLPLHQTNQLK